MYIQEPEGGFVSRVRYIKSCELDICELKELDEVDINNTGIRENIRRDRLVFDDTDDEFITLGKCLNKDEGNKFFDSEVLNTRTRLKENSFKNNRSYYDDINDHGILNYRKDDKDYSIKSIYDSIVDDRHDSIFYDDKKYKKQKCYDKKSCQNEKDYYGDDEYACNGKKCDKFESENIIEDTCTGAKCKEDKVEEKYQQKCNDKTCKDETIGEIIEDIPEEIIEEVVEDTPEEVVEENKPEVCEEDFEIIKDEIKGDIEYSFTMIGSFTKKLSSDQIMDLHICIFKEIFEGSMKNNLYFYKLKEKLLSSGSETLDMTINKFKQLYKFQSNALNTMKVNMDKFSNITKKQIEYKARDILQEINKFSVKLENLFRKLTIGQIMKLRQLIINVSMKCYLEKIVGVGINIENGMSSKVNMYLNWLRRILEVYLNLICEKCDKNSAVKYIDKSKMS